MGLAPQTVALFQAARQLVQTLPGDAVLLYTETDLDWDAVQQELDGCRLLVAAQDRTLTSKLKKHPNLTVLDIDPGPTPTQERMSLALLEAVRSERLRQSADVVALYNGIEVGSENPEAIDSLSIIHLGEHLERLSAGPAPTRYPGAARDAASSGGPGDGDRPRRTGGPSSRDDVCRRRHA